MRLASKMAVVVLPGVLWLGVGCQSYTEQTESVVRAVRRGHYAEAFSQLQRSDLGKSDMDVLLYLLEAGSIHDRWQRHEEARALWLRANSKIDELYTQSLSAEAATFLVYDQAAAYPGEDFEKVFLRAMLALSFLATADDREALVEARAINTRLEATRNAEEDADPNAYREDGAARFLAGTLYEARGELESALIDYTRAHRAYRTRPYQQFVAGGVPEPVRHATQRLARTLGRDDVLGEFGSESGVANVSPARVVVFHPTGVIAPKVAREFFLPIDDRLVRFSFPVVAYRSLQGGGFTGVVVGGRSVRAHNLINLNELAHHALEARRTKIIARGLARILIKGQITEHVSQQLGPVAGLAANVIALLTETADTRSWRLLPEALWVTCLELPLGEHQLEFFSDGESKQRLKLRLDRPGLKVLRG